MAEVYVAHPEGAPTRHVVIKRIRPSLLKAQSEKVVEMFVREAKLLATMKHANIVQVLELGQEPRRDGGVEHFIVMELLKGEELGDRLERVGRVSPDEGVAILVQVARALDKAHDHIRANLDGANLRGASWGRWSFQRSFATISRAMRMPSASSSAMYSAVPGTV